MFKVEITLPNSTFVLNHKGEAVNVDWQKMPAGVLGDILEGGAKIILKNSYNSGGKDKGDAEKLAGMLKRLDSWYKGNYAIVERASSQATLMREAYVSEMQAKHPGLAASKVEAKIKETVKAQLGESENATFDNFLTALAMSKHNGDRKAAQPTLEKLQAHWEGKAAELAAQRDAASVEIDLTDFDL